jgi:uncharacterized protein
VTATTEPQPRIATLDIVRGVAVMGILGMNILAFSMPPEAYMNPVAFGMETTADFVAWIGSFIFVDGKMRGLFSFLFGASMLLVIQRAEAGGESARSVHFRRMAWLLVFGLLHFYFIWYGDILAQYAVIGMIAWLLRNKENSGLFKWAFWLILTQFVMMAMLAWSLFGLSAAATAPGADPALVAQWNTVKADFSVPTAASLSETLALYRGGYAGIFDFRATEDGFFPLLGLFMFGSETLGYMLLGMAALKNGFFRGEWNLAAYRRTALIGFAIGIPAYAVMAWLIVSSGYDVPVIVATTLAASVLFRPAMIVATAALIILLTRQGGPLTDRIAAAGRAAFTNYLGTSIVMTTLFYGYGLGLYGTMGRAEVWLVVVAMWAVMLLWSKPWLERYRYGPFEWLWRTLARGKPQPMRRLAQT